MSSLRTSLLVLTLLVTATASGATATAKGSIGKGPLGKRIETFAFYRPAEAAKEVYLAGSFNKWQPTGQKMTGPDSDGYYSATVKLPHGQHEYKFVVDGKQWHSDPSNPLQTGQFHNSVLALKP